MCNLNIKGDKNPPLHFATSKYLISLKKKKEYTHMYIYIYIYEWQKNVYGYHVCMYVLAKCMQGNCAYFGCWKANQDKWTCRNSWPNVQLGLICTFESASNFL